MKKEYKFQILIIFAGFLFLWMRVIIRLYSLQIADHDEYESILMNQMYTTKTITPLRGDIVDKNGYVLATSKQMESLYISAYHLKRKEKELKFRKKFPKINHMELAKEFATILNLPTQEVREKFKLSWEQGELYDKLYKVYLETKDKSQLPELTIQVSAIPPGEIDLNKVPKKAFDTTSMWGDIIYLKRVPKGTIAISRLITKEQALIINRIISEQKFPGEGIWFALEEKRLYPRGDLASPVIGVTKFDEFGEGSGNLGLERKYDNELHGKMKRKIIKRTGTSAGIDGLPDEDFFSYVGNKLVLTLDVDIQEITENALKKALARYRGDVGVAVVMKVKTGEILAMSSLPSFSPENYGKISYPDYCLKNYCVQSFIEPGSVAKIFSFATAIDTGVLNSIDRIIDCQGGSAYFGRRLIRDAAGENLGKVTAREVFYHSSNVGTNKIAQDLDPVTFRDYLAEFGAGKLTGIDLPGEMSGIFHELSKWTSASMTSLPIGYELALSPISVITAVAAIVNNGVMMKPFIVKEIRKHNGELVNIIEPQTVRKVVKESTSKVMRDLMESVVISGTGRALAIPGYRLGGKTGTTKRIDGRGNFLNYISSFVGCLPINDPEYIVYAWIDNPKGAFYAATVAVPIARDIFEGIIKVYGIQPTSEIIPTITPTPNPSQRIVNNNVNNNNLLLAQADSELLYGPNPDDAAVGPIIPDLIGKSMREAKNILLKNNIDKFNFEGSGVVIEQTPPSGVRLNKKDVLKVKFSPKNAG